MKSAIVFLTFLAFTPLEGVDYAFLFTPGFPNGIIGVKFLPSSKVSCDHSGFIGIDKSSGKLKLLKELPKINTQNPPKDIECTVDGKSTIFIRVLQSCAGNDFANIIEKLKTNVHEKKNPNKNIGKPENWKSINLLHDLRAIPPGDPTRSRSFAELKVEKFLEFTKHKLKEKFRSDKNFGSDTVVIALFHVNQLFSKSVLLKLKKVLGKHRPPPNVNCKGRIHYRTFNGECNNLRNRRLCSAGTEFLRILPAKYFDADGLNDPIGFPDQPNAPDVPSPFEISRDFIEIEKTSLLDQNISHVVMQFGQFLDHDLDLTDNSEGGAEFCEERDVCNLPRSLAFQAPCFPILPISNGQASCINFVRSAASFEGYRYPGTRQQTNLITAFIDGSQIYGSNKETANSLRALKNDQGLLRVSTGDLLPEGPDELGEVPCIGGCLQAGDVRSNEQQSLNSFHTLFLREHNRVATNLKNLNSGWNGEKVYQETRKILGAVLQKMVYEDYLPVILGPGALQTYADYNESVNPCISNAFATAAYRFGHSTIRTDFDLLDKHFEPISPASINLRFMFFNNTLIRTLGIDPILIGLVGNTSAPVDRRLAEGIVNNLFERPESGSPGLNLAALNIQRSRDHGLPNYNEFRKFCGLRDAKSFADTDNEIQNPENRRILSRLYNDDPNLTELWVAGLAEDAFPGASMGPTLRCVIAEQFRRTRDGDRFYYEKKGVFSDKQLEQIKSTSLSRIYCDNLKEIVSMPRNAFRREPAIICERIPGIDLCVWKDCPGGEPQFDKSAKKCICPPKPICKVKTTNGRCCVFPFIYKKNKYVSCTTVDYGNKLWCATTSNYDKDKKWGNCKFRGRSWRKVRIRNRQSRRRYRRGRRI